MKNRQLNIELLRILSMLSILYWHFESVVISHNAIDENLKSILYTISSFGLNTFVLITGYFMINKTEIKPNKLVQVFIQTVFYTVGITTVFFCLGKASLYEIVVSLNPFAPSRFNYWFVSHYLALMLIQPYLSRLALSLNKTQYTLLIIILVILCTEMFPFFPLGYLFSSPWKVWWMICLFFTGGYLRLYMPERFERHAVIRLVSVTVALLVFIQIVISLHVNWIKTGGYNTLTEYLYSVLIFLLFRQLHISKGSWLVGFISPCVFSVYLIHNHYYVMQYMRIIETNLYQSIQMNNVCFVLLFCISVFLFCICIDRLRLLVFKLCRVPEMESKMSEWLKRKIMNFLPK